MAKRTRKQHYVPQFYLRHFQYDKKGRILAYNKHKQYFAPVSTASVAYEQDFYDFSLAKEVLSLEPVLAVFDSLHAREISPLLRRLEPGYQLTDAEVAHLAHFIHFQLLRTRLHLDQNKLYMNKTYQGLVDSIIEKNFDEPSKIAVEPDPEAVKLLGSKMFVELHKEPLFLEEIWNRFWRILEAPDDVSFITSDSPVILTSYGFKGQPVGWFSPGSQLLFPLSPDFLLVSSGLKLKGGRGHIAMCLPTKAALVEEANVRQVQNCLRFAFSGYRHDLQTAVEQFDRVGEPNWIPPRAETWNLSKEREFFMTVPGRKDISSVFPADRAAIGQEVVRMQVGGTEGIPMSRGVIKLGGGDPV